MTLTSAQVSAIVAKCYDEWARTQGNYDPDPAYADNNPTQYAETGHVMVNEDSLDAMIEAALAEAEASGGA